MSAGMKKSLFLFILLLPFSSFADELLMPFERFKEAIDELSKNRFFNVVKIENNTTNYIGMMIDSSGLIVLLKVESPDKFGTFEKYGQHYLFNENEAIYFEHELLSSLQINIPVSGYVFTLSQNSKGKKLLLEELATTSGLTNLDRETPIWPDEIKESFRLEGEILHIEKKSSHLEGFRFEVKIIALMSDTLLHSLKKVSAFSEKTDDFISVPDMILIFKGGSFKYLETCCDPNSQVYFTYFIR
ncbi:MAG: hypothetical protein CVT92_05455 [Bacteroidetes bacterium HGW-Bacteroidetes-1]|jgi:hypothetical protein|nr:MAG: hypothetical protein CVT92_05455 [Bacteroidetes bacterium HGW-Bacteroidetes-1]